jgi:hypothetical protein
MKKLLATLLILCAGPVWAEWVLYGVSGSSKHFIDPSTIRGTTLKKAWGKVEYETPDELDGRLSVRRLIEFDCSDEKLRLLQFTAFDGSNLTGRVVKTMRFRDPEWVYAAPGTIAASGIEIVCGTK